MKHPSLVAAMVVLLLFCCVMPVSAVLPEETYKGQVATVNSAKYTLTIKTPELYSCTYPLTGDPVCGWTPLEMSSLTRTVPDPAVFLVFSGAELVVATSLGGEDGYWITLAKLYGSKETQQLITDVVGDPGKVPYPLLGNYSVDTEMVPDCSACTGATCTAKQAEVTVKSSGRTVDKRTLLPGESLTYSGRNDGSMVIIKFISGSAASRSCPGMSGMVGPQAIPVFLIAVTPPIGYDQVNIRTATTTRPDEALPTTVSATGQDLAVSQSFPGTEAPSADPLPLVTVGAVLGAAFLCFRRK